MTLYNILNIILVNKNFIQTHIDAITLAYLIKMNVPTNVYTEIILLINILK